MLDTEALAKSKDVWSIIQGYAGFFKPAPLDSKSKTTGREMLKTAIAEVMPQLPKERPEWALFDDFIKELNNPDNSIQACAEKIAIKISQPGIGKPISGFKQFLEDVCIAFSDEVKMEAVNLPSASST